MYISGIGTVFNRGRGPDALAQSLEGGWRPPQWRDQPSGQIPVYGVSKATLTDKVLFKKMRRADRFSRMAVMAATDAFGDALKNKAAFSPSLLTAKQNLGIIIATALGPHATTFKYLDDILDYGDGGTSPTLFSHSVHNAAASYIAATLECRGPTLTISQFGLSFHHALILARAWLDEGRCDYVLAGSVDECSPAMEYIVSQKVSPAADGRIQPFTFSDTPTAVPGEGSVFMLLTREKPAISYAAVTDVAVAPGDDSLPLSDGKSSDMVVVDCDGMAGNEQGYLPTVKETPCLAAYSPIFGSLICNSAFNLAAGALMLKNQTIYACPSSNNNPHNLKICKKTASATLNRITCLKKSPLFKNGAIILER